MRFVTQFQWIVHLLVAVESENFSSVCKFCNIPARLTHTSRSGWLMRTWQCWWWCWYEWINVENYAHSVQQLSGYIPVYTYVHLSSVISFVESPKKKLDENDSTQGVSEWDKKKEYETLKNPPHCCSPPPPRVTELVVVVDINERRRVRKRSEVHTQNHTHLLTEGQLRTCAEEWVNSPRINWFLFRYSALCCVLWWPRRRRRESPEELGECFQVAFAIKIRAFLKYFKFPYGKCTYVHTNRHCRWRPEHQQQQLERRKFSFLSPCSSHPFCSSFALTRHCVGGVVGGVRFESIIVWLSLLSEGSENQEKSFSESFTFLT